MMLAFSSSFAARDLSSFSPSHQLIFVSSPIQSLLSTRPLLRLCPEAKRRIPSIAAYCAPIRGPEPSKGMAVVEEVDRFVEVANKVADSAGEVLRKYFRQSFVIIDKDDLSPVTIADREAEDSMVSIILETFPRHAIFGEENGWRCKEESADYVWVLDPIDGTKSFITGKPLFGTLIALLHKGKPIVGIIDQPILRERWVGVAGRRTTMNGEAASTRACSKLSQAYLYTTSPHLFSGDAEKAFWRVRDKVKVPLYGCDCYAYALLASGFVDLVIESGLKPYDVLSLVPVIEGAGGSITDWKGLDVQWDATLNSHPASFNVIAAGDSNIHKQALDELQWK
ncbi:bifunctional phosphatase IMPL2, chloroplastic-like [Zingiber officinale]|uniref:bifunctional phosphatase IMPL2, chloroplastic-like n=1 Tax=Zingiber officinale TaxID=94328 RepID=UPI001C4DD72E|nr:bifunctional phosphatase IMPL2, chloroplastic-like [Zingiber officinale]